MHVAVKSPANFLKWSVKSKYFVLAIPAVLQLITKYSNQFAQSLTLALNTGDADVHRDLLIKAGIEHRSFLWGTRQSVAKTNAYLHMSLVEAPSSAYSYVHDWHDTIQDHVESYKEWAKDTINDCLDDLARVQDSVEDLEKSVFVLRGFNGLLTGSFELLDKIMGALG